MKINKNELRNKIIKSLKSQGFLINPHLHPKKNERDTLRKLHQQKRLEQMKLHKAPLLNYLENVKEFGIDDNKIKPNKIDLELIEVKPDSLESKLFLWWNLAWWSLPYEKSIGRQMRFILWDKTHQAPFGLIGLQSPPLRSSVRDNYIGLNNRDIDYWINQSLYGQRIGALPPYNELLGGKMVALSLTSNELRRCYERKYENRKTILKKRRIPNRLLFITTTSAYGKSSVYERIKYNGEIVSEFIGYTAGSGTFHLPEQLYKEVLIFLQEKGADIKRGYGTGPSRKLKLVDKAFGYLKIPSFTFHNIRRGYYLFPHVKNLKNVIQKNKRPLWYNRPFNDLADYWKEGWCIPRSERTKQWQEFNSKKFFKNVEMQLKRL